MKNLLASIMTKLNTTKLGLGVLAALSGGTAFALLPHSGLTHLLDHPGLPALDPSVMPALTTTDERGVKITVKPSQTKMVQGSGEELYLDVNVEVPELTQAKSGGRKPTDLVLVLDRSGSMADENKLEFAKAAMHSLVDRLSDQDRIGIVTFDDTAVSNYPLAAATSAARADVQKMISRLHPGGGTNMGDGLELGRAMVHQQDGRSARVILLSDGMANVGVSTPEGLTGIVKSIGKAGAVVSTIGMGSDFNEAMLARLADHGMGSYTYMASNANLGQVLEKDLGDAREQFASASYLLLDLGPSVTVTDAAGYPVDKDTDGRTRVPLGQLQEGTTRSLVISLRAPVSTVGEEKLAGVELSYERNGKSSVVKAGDKPLALQVVAPEKSAEAVASIDGAVFKKSWVSNNAGRMKKAFSDNIRDGNQEGARKVLNEYRAKLDAVQATTGIATKDAELEQEMNGLAAEATDAFSGSYGDQKEKQKVYAKKGFSSGLGSQRSVSKVKPGVSP